MRHAKYQVRPKTVTLALRKSLIVVMPHLVSFEGYDEEQPKGDRDDEERHAAPSPCSRTRWSQ